MVDVTLFWKEVTFLVFNCFLLQSFLEKNLFKTSYQYKSSSEKKDSPCVLAGRLPSIAEQIHGNKQLKT